MARLNIRVLLHISPWNCTPVHTSSVPTSFIFPFAFSHCNTCLLYSLCRQTNQLQVSGPGSSGRESCGLLSDHCILPCNFDTHAAEPQVFHLGYVWCLIAHRFCISLLLVQVLQLCCWEIPCFWVFIVIFLSQKRKFSFKSVWRNLPQSITCMEAYKTIQIYYLIKSQTH